MSEDTARPPYIAYKLFLIVTSELGHHVESCQNLLQISTGHKLRPIFMKLGKYDLQTKMNKRIKQLSQIQNCLAVTANQT